MPGHSVSPETLAPFSSDFDVVQLISRNDCSVSVSNHPCPRSGWPDESVGVWRPMDSITDSKGVVGSKSIGCQETLSLAALDLPQRARCTT
ncbi:hypothetical protein Poly41_12670 [Novipirellula artificiosorum]|uniref:Uncharacterized protein n=1 Tax=Novipirellula artificiosorum TaxID=2528016 RepID=A0A5C6DW14_9BACT|nr:hypothetical protein Poly41_12670 [Novipirellula artificiosorum]